MRGAIVTVLLAVTGCGLMPSEPGQRLVDVYVDNRSNADVQFGVQRGSDTSAGVVRACEAMQMTELGIAEGVTFHVDRDQVWEFVQLPPEDMGAFHVIVHPEGRTSVHLIKGVPFGAPLSGRCP